MSYGSKMTECQASGLWNTTLLICEIINSGDTRTNGQECGLNYRYVHRSPFPVTLGT